MLKVSPWKGVVRIGKRGKLNPGYVGPFKVLEKIGKVAYRLELPKELSRVHNTFHEPVEIIDREVKRLKQSRISLVKVRWNSKQGLEFTWEREDQFRKKYPHLFTKTAPSSSARLASCGLRLFNYGVTDPLHVSNTFLAIAITFDLPTVEPEDSLSMGDEYLDTILETESDEFIKSSVENLVLSPSESEDLSDSECDVPACNDFTTFSNLLFDADDDFSSNPHHFNAESDLIESLRNHDSSIISSYLKIDYLLDEFAGELILLKIIPPGIDETDCDPEEEIRIIEKFLYDNSSPRIDETDCDPEEEIRIIEKFLYDNSSPRPPKEFISENYDAAIESFSPSPILVEDSDSFMEEIDLSFTPDDPIPPGIEEDDYDCERDMLSNDSLSLPENESFHFDTPKFPSPLVKPPDDDLAILTVKMLKYGGLGQAKRL
nr:putative reverse transcriptase domain-containing protein [Tanacetum cinerariifolium]